MNFSSTSRVLVQGITGSLGAIYTPLMLKYGTQVVAGVAPGHGGQWFQHVPVFDMVEQAVGQVGRIDAAVIFVEPFLVLDAALEAIISEIPQIVLIPTGVPPLDMVRLVRKAEASETLMIGPDSPGVIVPGQILLGTYPAELYTPGRVGIISRCGTLTHEIAYELTRAGLGQSIAVGIGGDRIMGSSFQQWLQILEEDDNTDIIVLVGEIGGDSEETAAHYIAEAIDKPVVAYIAGRTAPKDRVMGHAGAIIASQVTNWGAEIGTAESKIVAFKKAKVAIADRPSQIPTLVKKAQRKTTTGKKK